MQRYWLWVPVLAACGSSPGRVTGAPPAGGERADISSVRADLDVYTDGKGHLLALVEPDPERPVPDDLRLFYGDGKRFHAVPTTAARADGLKFEIGFRDPRIPSVPAGTIKRELGKVVLSCEGSDVELTRLPRAEAQAMVGAAEFVKSRSRFAPLALVRDGDRYLYVDYALDAEKQYRVFSGKKGDMREIPVRESSFDERRDTWSFKTDQGTLLASRDPKQRSYTLGLGWEGKKEAWTPLDRSESWRLIFDELGVYSGGRSPTPCDPMMP